MLIILLHSQLSLINIILLINRHNAYIKAHTIHTYIHTYMHTYIQAYIHTHIHTQNTYIHYSYIHACMYANIHTCMHTNIHTYIHAYIHIPTLYYIVYVSIFPHYDKSNKNVRA